MNLKKNISELGHDLWKTQKVNLLALLFFLVATIFPARNLLKNLDKVIIGHDFDTHINLWADWWTAKALTDPTIDFWETDYLTYPQQTSLIYHSFSPLNTAVSLSLRTIFNPLAAYNLAILLNYILAGLAMFQLVRFLTQSTTAALLAGIVFAFNSHNLFQSAHPVLVSVWCLPWATLYFLQAMRTNKTKYIFIAALFVFLGTLTSLVLTFLMALWFGFLWIICFFAPKWPRPSLRLSIIFVLSCMVLVMVVVFPQIREAVGSANSSFVIDPRTVISLDVAAVLIPHWFVWFSWTIYLGISAIPLIFMAYRHKWEALPWYILLIGSWLVAIGPYPQFLQKPIDLFLPWSLPFIPFLRNPYRLSILMAFALAALVAYGWLTLARQIKNQKIYGITFLVIGLLIYGDYTIPALPYTPLNVSPFFTDYLDTVPDDIALAMLPSGRATGKVYMYYQSLHGHKMSGGTISRPNVDSYSFIANHPLLRAGDTDLDPEPIPSNISRQLSELSAVNIGYLTLNKTFMMPEELEKWQLALPFIPVFEDELVTVFSTDPLLGRDFEVEQMLTDSLAWIDSDYRRQEDDIWKLTLSWLAVESPATDIEYEIVILDKQDQIVERIRQPLIAGFPSSEWRQNEIVSTQDLIMDGADRHIQIILYGDNEERPLLGPIAISTE